MKYPKKIHIGFQEGTCPLKCKKCYAFGGHDKRVKKVQKMPLENAKQLIDEISQWKEVPSVQPSIYTEPFANEDLKEIILYCRKKNVPINIITNGILLDKLWMDFLIEHLNEYSSISFSLDAVTQEIYEKVRGNYSLKKLENKIEYLVNNRGVNGLHVSVNFTYEEDNFHEKEAFLEKWKGKVDAIRITAALDSYKKIPDIYKKEGVVERIKECPYLTENMTIDSCGEVRLCPLDAFGDSYLGNVFDKGMISIWNGGKMAVARKKHKENNLIPEDFCYGCEGGYSIYNFNKVEETEEFVLKISDYAIYYNCKKVQK